MGRPRNYDPYGGFSIVGIVLSDALPSASYHPDFLRRIQEEKYRPLVQQDKTQGGEEKP